MKSRDLIDMGIPPGKTLKLALDCIRAAATARRTKRIIHAAVRAVIQDPEAQLEDEHFGPLALALVDIAGQRSLYAKPGRAAPYRQWGTDIDENSIQQMENACRLPVSVRGALMPDAHLGYGLPIGGVLATRNAVIPYAVGVDIACRMKMTVLDLPVEDLDRKRIILEKAINDETRFGIGCGFQNRRHHDVLDEDWSVSKISAQVKDKAWKQLGSSGSGNHFVEFGSLEIEEDTPLGLAPGSYLALLSHSGSRGPGAMIAGHYSKLAMGMHPELPRELRHLAWLDLSSAAGQEYWNAMELMGKYAAANHACIHRHISKHLGAHVLLDLENHHNFAWKEEHDGEQVIVHRKGATPAGAGVLGIIPGTMATSTYIVRGKGNPDSLQSAAHGAGRVMSRKQAKRTFNWDEVKAFLKARRVTLMSAGLDECPMVYKDIDKVMAAQADLVEPLAKFQPRIVKMAPAGERPED